MNPSTHLVMGVCKGRAWLFIQFCYSLPLEIFYFFIILFFAFYVSRSQNIFHLYMECQQENLLELKWAEGKKE